MFVKECLSPGWVAPLFAYTDADGWRPGIGDPTVMGWVTVAAYLLGGFLCVRAALAISPGGLFRNREGKLWLLLGIALFLLGVNKQLDLQTWFTLTAKKMAQAQGWYEQRRIVHAAFVLGIAVAGLLAVWWVWRQRQLFLSAPAATWLALAGFVFLGCFILVRAASFHHVDAFLKAGPGAVRMNWVLELGGILMLGWGAMKRASAEKPRDRALAPAHSRGALI